MNPLPRLALLGSLVLVVCPTAGLAAPASAPAPSVAVRCSVAAPAHGRAAIEGPCRISDADLRRAVFRLPWQTRSERGAVAGELRAGPLEALVAETPEALRRYVTRHPEWHQSAGAGETWRPFLSLEKVVDLPFGQDLLVQLSDGGFENRFDVFLTGRRQGGEVVLTGALEPVFRVSIGTVEIMETHALNDDEALIFGRTGGGDNGEVWGSVWLGWLGPRGFRVMVEEPYSYQFGAGEERRFGASFSTSDLRLEIQERRPGRRDDDPAGWRTVSTRDFDLRPLLAEARRAASDALAGPAHPAPAAAGH